VTTYNTNKCVQSPIKLKADSGEKQKKERKADYAMKRLYRSAAETETVA